MGKIRANAKPLMLAIIENQNIANSANFPNSLTRCKLNIMHLQMGVSQWKR